MSYLAIDKGEVWVCCASYRPTPAIAALAAKDVAPELHRALGGLSLLLVRCRPSTVSRLLRPADDAAEYPVVWHVVHREKANGSG